MPETEGLASDPAFQRAFIALSYFAGSRDRAELAPFASRTREAAELLLGLSLEDRKLRAAVLGRELERIARSLDAWGLR